MKWKKKDPRQWEGKFAFTPTLFGEKYVWLEFYRQRLAHYEPLRTAVGGVWFYEREHGGLVHEFSDSWHI